MHGASRCVEVRDLLQPFQDGELDVPENVVVLKHLELCDPCRARSEHARALTRLLAEATPEPLAPDLRGRLLEGAFAQSERPRRRRAPFLAAAAGLLMALSLSAVAYADPACYLWGCLTACPTKRVMDYAALAVRPESAVGAVEAEMGGAVSPDPCRMECVGRDLVSVAGSGYPERPLFKLRCMRTEAECYVLRIPGARVHRWKFKAREDGRRYLEVTHDGVRVIGWLEDETLALCVGREGVSSKHLFAMAARVRDAEGRVRVGN